MSEERPNFLTSMKKASQRFASTVADAGARTMLKTDVAFLERDIKARKQALGIEVYDILKAEDSDDGGTSSSSSSSSEIQKAFDECRADIRHLEARVSSKRGEMEAIERSSGHAGSGGSVGGGGGMDDAETPGIPSTP